eukprot:TRINITY_DN34610_c0_g1_i2.p2 TRINITY_DN34610_c0_g1~~TRINITY_DN34610_c0_g1_i2.p2  ORF type:complete len:217 (-),score=40.11 TRINITY_DN34610_c0_g1_i2:1206-1856(-)
MATVSERIAAAKEKVRKSEMLINKIPEGKDPVEEAEAQLEDLLKRIDQFQIKQTEYLKRQDEGEARRMLKSAERDRDIAQTATERQQQVEEHKAAVEQRVAEYQKKAADWEFDLKLSQKALEQAYTVEQARLVDPIQRQQEHQHDVRLLWQLQKEMTVLEGRLQQTVDNTPVELPPVDLTVTEVNELKLQLREQWKRLDEVVAKNRAASQGAKLKP